MTRPQPVLSDDGKALLELLWEEFKKRGCWPPKKPVIIAFHGKGRGLDDIIRASGRAFWVMNGSNEQVCATFDALVTLPEVRSLFAAVPDLLRLSAERFVSTYKFMGEGPEPRVSFEDFRRLWSSDDAALLAMNVMDLAQFSPLRKGGSIGPLPTDVFFRPSIGSLRYEKVETLDEVLELSQQVGRGDVGMHPSGKPLAVLKAVFAHAVKTANWPVALPFAVDHRELGDVPELIRDLSPTFIRNGYGESRYNLLELTSRSVAYVDTEGEGRALLLNVVKAIAALWKGTSENTPITLPDIAKVLGVSLERLREWALFFEWEPWGNLGQRDKVPEAWIFTVRENVLLNESISSWEQYMAQWHPEMKAEEYRNSSDGELEPQLAPVAVIARVPALKLGFMQDDGLRRLVERDAQELWQTLNVRAWKASMILAGNLVEAVLLDVLGRRPDLAASFLKKNKGWPDGAGLSDLICIALNYRLIQPTSKTLAEIAKDYRDLVHPANASKSVLRVREDTANASATAFELICADLHEASRDGRLTAFENHS